MSAFAGFSGFKADVLEAFVGDRAIARDSARDSLELPDGSFGHRRHGGSGN